MAADRGDVSRPNAAAGLAMGVAAKARRRGGEAGRLRLRLFSVILIVAAQCGLAAALSWGLAHHVLGRPSPIFAPSAAVGTIVAALGQHARRTAELMLGVGLGPAISDLLVRSLGFGLWQIGLVVALAIAVALLATGHSGALVAQAGSTAVLIATFAHVERGLQWARIVDAGVEASSHWRWSRSCYPSIRCASSSATAPVAATLRTQLRKVAHALAERDRDRAMRALDQLSAMDPDLERMHEALGGAEEVTVIAPARWQRRLDVAHYQAGIPHIDRVSLEARELARWAGPHITGRPQQPETPPPLAGRQPQRDAGGAMHDPRGGGIPTTRHEPTEANTTGTTFSQPRPTRPTFVVRALAGGGSHLETDLSWKSRGRVSVSVS